MASNGQLQPSEEDVSIQHSKVVVNSTPVGLIYEEQHQEPYRTASSASNATETLLTTERQYAETNGTEKNYVLEQNGNRADEADRVRQTAEVISVESEQIIVYGDEDVSEHSLIVEDPQSEQVGSSVLVADVDYEDEVAVTQTGGGSEAVVIDAQRPEQVVVTDAAHEDVSVDVSEVAAEDDGRDEERAVTGVLIEEHTIEDHQLAVEVSESSEQVLLTDDLVDDTVPWDTGEVETVTANPVVINATGIEIPNIELSDGYTIPAIGFGTWLLPEDTIQDIISSAIDIGYRHFDCAHLYQNEKAVGAALRAKIDDGTVSREDLFVTSKLWANQHKPQNVESACRRSLEELGLDYLDLYVMHTPFGFKDGQNLLPKIAGVLQFSPHDYLETWYAMEALVKKGLVRSIGVANFNSVQINRLLGKAKIKPVINQIECHPYLNQKRLSEFCNSRGIVVAAYGVLGSPSRPLSRFSDEPNLLDDERVHNATKKCWKSAAQILVRYQVEKGHVVIAKTTDPRHLLENLEAFGFSLDHEDFEFLDNIRRSKRYTDFVGMGETHKDYPFTIPF